MRAENNLGSSCFELKQFDRFLSSNIKTKNRLTVPVTLSA